MPLTEEQRDRARGALLGSATGDALGAGYEFEIPTLATDAMPEMKGGGLGGFAPGEWTDDTVMMWGIAEVAAQCRELHSTAAQDAIAEYFARWNTSGPADIGVHTKLVLDMVGAQPTAAEMFAAAAKVTAKNSRSSGNGSLMRTAPVALPYLHDPEMAGRVAAELSALTHPDPHAMQACVLWSLAIRHAIIFGEFELRAQLKYLEPEAAQYWAERIDEAESQQPETFSRNGWSVAALQAAWSGIVNTPEPEAGGAAHFAEVLSRVISIGYDTDTVAAIAGALLGARWGAAQIPAHWVRMVHGYPGKTGTDLLALADACVGDIADS